jgi:hypothetical protein
MSEGGWSNDDPKDNPQVAQIGPPRSWDEITNSPPSWGWQPAPPNPSEGLPPRQQVPPEGQYRPQVPDWGFDPTRPANPNPWTTPGRPLPPPTLPERPSEQQPAMPVPGGRYVPRLDPTGRVIIPTLHIDKQQDQNDATTYAPDSEEAKIYAQSRDAVAQVYIQKDGQTGAGSGFFITPEGKLATAYHVVAGAEKIMVQKGDRQYEAKIVSHKPGSDIAVLELQGAGNTRFSHLQLAESTDHLKNGSTVYAIGHPNGWSDVYLSKGSVNSMSNLRDQEFPDTNPNRMLVVSHIHVNRGSSGSPLLDDKGNVVGILNFIAPGGVSSAVIEDLRSTIGTASLRDYFPSNLYGGEIVLRQGMLTAFSGAQIPVALSASRLAGAANRFGGIALAGSGAWDLYKWDYPHFQTAWKRGSAAEKISSTINVGGDSAMIAGGLGMIFGTGKMRAVGAIAATVGIGAKFLNNVFTDRTY